MNEGRIRTRQFSVSADDAVKAWEICAQKKSLLHRIVWTCVGLLVAVAAAAPFILVTYTYDIVPGSLAWNLFSALHELRCLIWPLAGYVVLEFLVYPLVNRRNLRQAYAATRNLFQNIEVELNDGGVDTVRPGSHSHYAWSWYPSAIETSAFFLAPADGTFLIIPKESLTPEQVPQVADMLRRHIPRYDYRNT